MHFPFTAVVGQERIKTALLLISIDPKIGGLLLTGPRGSAKSTLVRSLADLNQNQPFVNLPLGASEEMVSGSFDLEAALNANKVRFRPGLLAKADQGFLYVDEVNLLADHLVDLLLDVAASGINRVERDAISHQHQARFSLVGTMNPDEGELRPQLLDRFGLVAPVASQFSLAQRQQIVRERLAFDAAPEEFMARQQGELAALAARLTAAKQHLSAVHLTPSLSENIAQCCTEAHVEGLRADITLHRAAKAHAALMGKTAVDAADIAAVVDLVLAHRRQCPADNANPPPPTPNKPSPPTPNKSSPPTPDKPSPSGNPPPSSPTAQSGSSIEGAWGKAPPQPTAEAINSDEAINSGTHAPSPPSHPRATPRLSQIKRGGKHGKAVSKRYLNTALSAKSKINWQQTLGARAFCPSLNTAPQNLQQRHLKYQFAEPKQQSLEIILLDTSASTLGGKAIQLAKGFIQGLSKARYKQRQHLALLSFGNGAVHTLLHPQRAPKEMQTRLNGLLAGGGTPIIKALDYTAALIKRNQGRYEKFSLTLISDGRLASTACQHPLFKLGAARTAARAIDARVVDARVVDARVVDVRVVDVESSRIKLGLAKSFAEAINALYIKAPAINSATQPNLTPAG